jgi:hypothetical protein
MGMAIEDVISFAAELAMMRDDHQKLQLALMRIDRQAKELGSEADKASDAHRTCWRIAHEALYGGHSEQDEIKVSDTGKPGANHLGNLGNAGPTNAAGPDADAVTQTMPVGEDSEAGCIHDWCRVGETGVAYCLRCPEKRSYPSDAEKVDQCRVDTNSVQTPSSRTGCKQCQDFGFVTGQDGRVQPCALCSKDDSPGLAGFDLAEGPDITVYQCLRCHMPFKDKNYARAHDCRETQQGDAAGKSGEERKGG